MAAMPDSPGGLGSAAKNKARGVRSNNRRTLSQNFLRGSAVGQYISMLDLDPDGVVVEVGAGDGALTTAIAGRCRRLIAYEIDPHYAQRLRQRVQQLGNVQLVEGDFLASRPAQDKFAVVGNVPFSITSQVVNWCLQARTMTSATIITQLEYAKKRTGAYGRWSKLTISTWPWISWQLRGRIARSQFRPMPRVDAGVLHIVRRPDPLIRESESREYRRMVEIGFGGSGGTLYKSLARHYPRARLDAAFDATAVDRPEIVAFVSPDAWLTLFRALRATR